MMPDMPEFGRSDLRGFLRANADRYVADGVPAQEVYRAMRELSGWESWADHWLARSAWFEERAADPGRSRPTVAYLLVCASLMAHLAQYLAFGDPVAREVALRHKIRTYRSALAWLDPPGRIIEVPFGDHSLPAVVRSPPGSGAPHPCVILVGGLDAHKEDAHAFGDLCLARGIAVIALDGPGQGEALLRGARLGDGAHLAVSATIDVLEELPELDTGRLGLVGRSLGGFLAARAAADDPRATTLVVWGAMTSLAHLATLPSHTRHGFGMVTGSTSEEATVVELGWLDLLPHAPRISASTLIVHGDADMLTPVSQAEALAAAIGDDCRLDVIPNSGHCNHEFAHLLRPAMADWLESSLRTQRS